MAAQRRPDRGRRHLHAKPQQLAPDPLVTPGRVLLGHADDQLLDILVQRWPTGLAMRVGPRAGDQVSVPALQRLRPDEEARPARPGQRTADRGQQRPVGRLELGSGSWRRSTVSWWRSTRSSRSLAASPRASSTSSWTERQTVRYASFDSTRGTSRVGGRWATLPSHERHELAAHRLRPRLRTPQAASRTSWGGSTSTCAPAGAHKSATCLDRACGSASVHSANHRLVKSTRAW
jgi:hypothetical protein